MHDILTACDKAAESCKKVSIVTYHNTFDISNCVKQFIPQHDHAFVVICHLHDHTFAKTLHVKATCQKPETWEDSNNTGMLAVCPFPQCTEQATSAYICFAEFPWQDNALQVVSGKLTCGWPRSWYIASGFCEVPSGSLILWVPKSLIFLAIAKPVQWFANFKHVYFLKESFIAEDSHMTLQSLAAQATIQSKDLQVSCFLWKQSMGQSQQIYKTCKNSHWTGHRSD